MQTNLQFFGGRGASGASIAGAIISKDGKSQKYYFTTSNGKTYYQRSLGETPQPTPQGMTAKQFINRAKANGSDVRIISSKEKASDASKRTEDRKEVDRFLNNAYARDKVFVKGSRANRIGNRATKKRK